MTEAARVDTTQRSASAWAVTLLAMVGATIGCSDAPSPPVPPDRVEQRDRPASHAPRSPAEVPSATPVQAWRVVRSAAGTFSVRWVATPDPIPVSDPFELDVELFVDPECTIPLTGRSLSVDAQMPHHGHGMNVRPSVTEITPGRYRVAGMLCHMPGRWEFLFDVTAGGLLERAQTTVELK